MRSRTLPAVGISAIALLAAATFATPPANSGGPAKDYIDDYVHDCLAPDQAGANTVTYRGHITTSLQNLAGDYAEKSLFSGDGYTTTTFKGQYRISGHTIGGAAFVTGGDTADVLSLSTRCVDIP